MTTTAAVVVVVMMMMAALASTGVHAAATAAQPLKTVKTKCTENGKFGVGCRVYATKWPGIMLYSPLEDTYKGSGDAGKVTELESNQWADQILNTLDAINALPTGRILLAAVSGASCRSRNIGVTFAPYNVAYASPINVAIRHGKVCLPTTRARTQSAAATDLVAAGDGSQGSDVVMDIDTCTMTGQALTISVAHELIHAYHHLHGRRDDCTCCEEGRTTGIFGDLIGCHQDGITENKIRAEMRMPMRDSYPDCDFSSMGAACPSNSGNRCTKQNIVDRKGEWCANPQATTTTTSLPPPLTQSATSDVKKALKNSRLFLFR